MEQQNEYNLFSPYTVTVSDHLPLVADFRIRNTVNTSDLSDLNIDIYPNPSDGRIIIDNPDRLIQNINVMDNEGRLVSQVSDPASRVEFNLSRGLYFIWFSDSNGNSKTEKLIVH